MSYEFVVKQIKVMETRNGILYEEDKIFLSIENKNTGLLLPHPITNFIKSSFDRKSLALKTQKNYAEEIKQFLNYILQCIEDENEVFMELKNVGVRGLRLIHGSSYLTYLTQRVRLENISPKKVFDAERILTKFYFWLSDQNIISEKVQYREETRKVKGKKETFIHSPFDNFELGTEYPNRRESGKKKKN